MDSKKFLYLVYVFSFILMISSAIAVQVSYSSSEIEDLSGTVLNNNTFVLFYCERDGGNKSFSIYDTNGTLVSGPVTIEDGLEVCNVGTYQSTQVSVSAFNESMFALGWYDNATHENLSFSIYDISGNVVTSEIDVKTNAYHSPAPINPTVSVTALNSTSFVFAYYGYTGSGVTGNISFITYDYLGNALSNEIFVTSFTEGLADEIDVSAFNETSFVIAWDDGSARDATFRTYTFNGTPLSAETDVDTDTGSFAGFISVSTFNNTDFVFGFNDVSPDLAYSISCSFNGTCNNLIQVDESGDGDANTIGTPVYVTAINSSNFLFAWYNESEIVMFKSFSANGTPLSGNLGYFESAHSSRGRPLAVISQESAISEGICYDNYILAWNTNGTFSNWTTYDHRNVPWTGICDAPLNPITAINSSIQTNSSEENLNCFYTLDHPLGNRMNVSVKWYNNSIEALHFDLNNSYIDTTNFSTVLNSGNLTIGESWSCSMRLYDGTYYSDWMESGAITILDTIPPGVTVNFPLSGLLYGQDDFPLNFNITLSEQGGAWYSLDNGVNNFTMYNTSDGNVEGMIFNATNSSLANGEYNFSVYANDTSGNTNYSVKVAFSVDVVSPEVSFIGDTPTNDSTQEDDAFVVNTSSSDENGEHYTFVDFDDSLAFWMRFDDVNSSGDPVDISEHSNNGSIANEVIINSTGQFGEGAHFDGDDDYINVGDYSSLNITQEISISMWIKTDTEHGGLLLSKWPIGSGASYYLMVTAGGSGRIRFNLVNDTETNQYEENYVYYNDEWQHVVATYNGSTKSLYVNGTLLGTPSTGLSGPINISSVPVQIATYGNGLAPFNGSIDEIMIFNRSLSANEIASLYNASANQYFNNFTDLDDGTHTYTGYVVDKAGNRNETDERTITTEVGTGVSFCRELNIANTVYTQTANIVPTAVGEPCLNITAQNITFDGDGFWISNRTLNETGIYAYQLNTTVRNTNISMNESQGGEAIFFDDGATEGFVLNNTVNFNHQGIHLETGSDSSVVANNTANSNSFIGLHIESDFVNVTANTLDSNYGGLARGALEPSGSDNIIRDNTVTSTTGRGIFLQVGDDNKVINNTISSSSSQGIHIQVASDGNEIANNSLTDDEIRLHSSVDNNVLIGNIIESPPATGIQFTSGGTGNTVVGGSINNSGDDAISVNSNMGAVNLTNITITNTDPEYYDIDFAETTANDSYLFDMPHIGNYSFQGEGSLVHFRDTDEGEIKFLQTINGTGTNLSNDIKISFNNVTVDSVSNYGFNRSANITLYNTPSEGLEVEVLRDDVLCGNDCSNLTNLNETTVVFNVTSFTSYGLGDATDPAISLQGDTPQNNSLQGHDSIIVNISSSDANEHYTFVDFDDSLVLWMRFDDVNGSGDPTDLSMYSINSSIQGDVVINSSGYFGDGAYFDSDGDYIPVVDGWEHFDNNWTFMFWMNAKGQPTGSQEPITSSTGAGGARYRVLYNDQNNFIDCETDDGDARISGFSGENEWHHIVCRYFDNGTMEAYLDGAFQDSTTTATTTDPSSNDYLSIGATSSGSNEFNGTLDEVLFFNRTLSPEEISAIYNASANQYFNNFTFLTDGTHTFKGHSVDIVGNRNETELREVSIDLTDPAISYQGDTPANGSNQEYDSMIINLSTSDSNEHYSFVDFDDSLVLWMRMDDVNASGDPTDLSRYSNNGSLGTEARINSTGYWGSALWGNDTSNSEITIPLAEVLDVGRTNFSASVWVYSIESGDTEAILELIEGADGNAGGWRLFKPGSDVIRFTTQNQSADTENVDSNAAIAENTWYHLLIVRNDTTKQLYINGILNSSGTHGGLFNRSFGGSETLSIGCNGASCWNGSIDEVMIFNRSLTEDEVLSLYNATANQYYNNFSGLADGTHTFTGYAVDKVGNRNESELREVNVDLTAPNISFQGETSGNNSLKGDSAFIVNLSSSDIYGDHYTFVDFDDSIVLWMTFDDVNGSGDPTDISTHSNNGTLDNEAFINSTGYWGDSMWANATVSPVLIPDTDILDFGVNQNFSISLWFKTNFSSENRDDTPEIIEKQASGIFYQIRATVNGTIAVQFDDGSDPQSTLFTNNSNLSYNNWHHFVLVRDYGNQIIAYVDGVQTGTGTDNAEGLNNTGNLIVGGGNAINQFNGSLDDVIIFNRSLTAAEIGSLYNASATQYYNNFTGLDDATHTFKGHSVDKVGNRNETDHLSITIDLTAPNITFQGETPANNSIQPKDAFVVNLSSSDSNGEHYSFVDFDDSLVMWMRFDDVNSSGDPTDISGKGNNGTFVNQSFINSSGHYGNGAHFDSVWDYITIPHGESVTFENNTDFSISAWVYFRDEDHNQMIINKVASLRGYYCYFQINSDVDRINCAIRGSDASTNTVSATGSISPNQWYHIVLTANRSDVAQIYLNGAASGSSVDISGVGDITSSNVMFIGAGSSANPTPDDFMNGSIDEVLVFNRSLIITEVQSLYNATANQYFNNFTGLDDATHTFKGHSVDKVGNRNETELREVEIDTTNPLVSYGQLTEGDGTNISRTNIFINVTVTEVNENTITFRLYNSTGDVNTTSFTDSTREINITGLPDENYTLNVTVNDTVGNQNTTETRTVIIDTTLPLISYGNGVLNDNVNVSQSNVYINVSVTESNEVNITFSLYNDTATVNSTTFTDGTREINITGLPDTNYSYNVTVYDYTNNRNETDLRYLTLDNVAPTIDFVNNTESNASTISDTFIDINVTSTDANLANITIRLYNSSLDQLNISSSSSSPFYVNFTNLSEGIYYFNATSEDYSGNVNYTETRTIILGSDDAPPNVTINVPTNTTYSSSSIDFNVTLSKNGSVIYSLLNWSVNVTMSTTDNQAFNYSNSSIAEGNYVFYVFANDSDGNVNNTENVSFAISTSSSSSSSSNDDDDDPSFWLFTYSHHLTDLTERDPIIQSLRKRHRIKIKVNGKNHHVGIVDVEDDNATINVSSHSQQGVFLLDDLKPFDLDHDDIFDIEIKLLNNDGTKVNISIDVYNSSNYPNITNESISIEMCGDGIVGEGEICDDGNMFNGDGCDDDCDIELDWSCSGEPSICTSLEEIENKTFLDVVKDSWNRSRTVWIIWFILLALVIIVGIWFVVQSKKRNNSKVNKKPTIKPEDKKDNLKFKSNKTLYMK